MESYLDHAPCLYFSCKDDGTLIHVNETFCKELGYTKEELSSKKLDSIFTIATRIFQQTHFFPLLKMHGHAEEIFITLLTKNNEHLPILINAIRNLDASESITVHTGIVVHNRKKYEDEIIAARKAAETALNQNTTLIQAKQELQKNMEQLDKQIHLVNKQNEELRQFNHVVTHDIQEPLRKISVFSSMLLQTDEHQNQKKTVGKLLRVSEQMRIIISGLQQYVWLTEAATKPVELDLLKTIQNVTNDIQAEFPEKKINVITEDIKPVWADAEQFRVLFYQLFSNAVRFSKKDEEVTIKVTTGSLMINQFRNIKEKYKYSEYFKIQVRDDGIGFDPVYKEQVFELFKRLHGESGRGIGLSLCRKIIENHHGEIKLDTQPEKGTTVTVLIPQQVPVENREQSELKQQLLKDVE